ncbi:MAG: hypothetical protein H0T69_15890 [Thermoleophilaceae bacterium]|nr:hypothetical protein [Thermoleophilaceae bacterium]
MGRGLAAVALLAALIIPTAAHAQGGKPSGRCDFTDPAVCLYPWPNDLFTKRDNGTPTGRRLNIKRASMPRNKDGVAIDPSDMNRADGFSPGSALLTKVPGLDTPEAFAASKLPPLTDLSRGLAANSPIVVINARTGKRHPIWAELDSTATSAASRILIVRPAVNFKEGERYIVALRNLKTAAGKAIEPSVGFRRYRDATKTRKRAIERRRAHFESLFHKLRKAGVRRDGLYLAWDFTVASRQSLAGRVLSIRDRAFAALGDTKLSDLKVQGKSPSFTIDSSIDLSTADDDRIARQVEGTLTVPCFLNKGCVPGGKFTFDRRGRPEQHGTTTAKFTCRIPRSALDPAAPPKARPSLYGHGLLGSRTEVNAGNVRSMANEHNFLFCATEWAGFSNEDLGQIVATIGDFSSFNTIADRMQQGFLNQLLLGRALIHPQGLSSNPAFQKNGQSVIDTSRLYFDGNSQGAIMGGALTSVAPDFQRAVLGVAGMNYSTLLQRSVDFDTYSQLIYPAYPKEIDRQLLFGSIQLLWDRGEADGYAQHMTSDPLPNTPKHQVLLHVAFGDHQVSDTTAEVEARTIGAFGWRPILDSGRSPWPRFQLIPNPPGPSFRGSAIVMWDTGPARMEGAEEVGTNAPPAASLPNRVGDDPHDNVRAMPAARVQKATFLINGLVVDVCGGRPCYAGTWTGP